MKFTLTYNVTVPDNCPISLLGMMTRAMRIFLFPHFTQKTSGERSSLSLIKLVKHKAGEFHCDGFDGLDPEPIQESDRQVLLWMNRPYFNSQPGIFSNELAWPKYLRNDLQHVANYRRWVTLQILNK